MPINGFSVGKDVTLDIISPLTGGLVQLSNITSFESRQVTAKIESHGIDGINRPLDIPKGWEGSFMLDRATQGFDLFVTLIEETYYAGIRLTPSTITETITEADGLISQFMYDQVSINFPELGKWTGDNKVEQQLAFRASRRRALV